MFHHQVLHLILHHLKKRCSSSPSSSSLPAFAYNRLLITSFVLSISQFQRSLPPALRFHTAYLAARANRTKATNHISRVRGWFIFMFSFSNSKFRTLEIIPVVDFNTFDLTFLRAAAQGNTVKSDYIPNRDSRTIDCLVDSQGSLKVGHTRRSDH